MIQTVLGAVTPSELGFTLMHEHMAMVDPTMKRVFDDWFDTDRFIELAVPQLQQVYNEGVRTILDPSPISLGRDVRLIKTLSEKSGIKMLVCTGLYYFDYPNVNTPDPKWLSKLFVRELTKGCEGTSIRAAAIKCATEQEDIPETNRNILQATAIACMETGAPILAHSNALHYNGLKQVQLFREMGVDMNKVVICHVDEAHEIDYALQILDAGAMVGFDRFGLLGRTTTENRVRILKKLLEMGYADRIVLGHDSHLYEDFWRPWHTPQYEKQSDTNNFHVLPVHVLPQMLADGVSQEMIDKMTVQNPAKLLNWC